MFEHFFPCILLLLYLKKRKNNDNTKNIDDFSLLIQIKKNYSKIKVYCNQNRHFCRDKMRDSRFFLTSSLYRSKPACWGGYRPIVRKIRYLLASLKKNVTRQALFHFGEYLFQSTHHFGGCLKKMVSHTIFLQITCVM
jgi:hypothetical protein